MSLECQASCYNWDFFLRQNINEPDIYDTKKEIVYKLWLLGHQCKDSLLYHWLFHVNHTNIPILSISFLLKLIKLMPFKKSSILQSMIFRYWKKLNNHKNKGVNILVQFVTNYFKHKIYYVSVIFFYKCTMVHVLSYTVLKTQLPVEFKAKL